MHRPTESMWPVSEGSTIALSERTMIAIALTEMLEEENKQRDILLQVDLWFSRQTEATKIHTKRVYSPRTEKREGNCSSFLRRIFIEIRYSSVLLRAFHFFLGFGIIVRVFLKVILSSPIFGPLFTPYPFLHGPQSKEVLLNLGIKCWNTAFNAQGSR